MVLRLVTDQPRVFEDVAVDVITDDLTHTGDNLGFYNVPITTRPTAPTAQTAAAPAGGVGVAAGGWSSAADRDTAIASINNSRTRIAEIETKLRALGLIT